MKALEHALGSAAQSGGSQHSMSWHIHIVPGSLNLSNGDRPLCSHALGCIMQLTLVSCQVMPLGTRVTCGISAQESLLTERVVCVQKWNPAGGRCLCSVKVPLAGLNASLPSKSGFKKLQQSPNGKMIMVQMYGGALLVLDLPTLSKRAEHPFPCGPSPASPWHADSTGWSPDNQPVLCWRTAVGISVALYAANDLSLLALHHIWQGTVCTLCR